MFPKGYHSVIPYLTVDDVSKFILFVTKVFDGTLLKSHDEDGGIYAEIQIGDSVLMVTSISNNDKSNCCTLWIYVEDVDHTYRKLLKEGAISVMEPTLKYEHDRIAKVKDPFGYQWVVATYND